MADSNQRAKIRSPMKIPIGDGFASLKRSFKMDLLFNMMDVLDEKTNVLSEKVEALSEKVDVLDKKIDLLSKIHDLAP